MNIDIADVTVHIDETLNHEHLEGLSNKMHEMEGVISVGVQDKRPHLMIIGFDPHIIQSRHVLNGVTDQGLHAELIGW